MSLNILATLLIFRRDSDSLFVFEEALALATVVVGGFYHSLVYFL